MSWLPLFAYFFAGFSLANAVPHVVSGMTERPFQSPPGECLSFSTINALWGFFNIIVGCLPVCRVGDFQLSNTAAIIAPGAGAFLISQFSARHFGRFNGGHATKLS